MKKFYSLLIAISVATAAVAQPTIPAAPVACNANNCTTTSSIDVCPPLGNTVVSSFTGGTYSSGNNGNNLGTGAIWRFRNMAVVAGVTVNAQVRIDAISNAVLSSIDDNSAVDQSNVSIASWFAPRIGPDQTLNGTNRRGYVQFTISFFRNATGTNNNTNADFANSVSLTNINYVHYDIDGSDANNVNTGTAGSWFRETGVARRISATNPMVLANASTELGSYSYTDAGNTWAGFAGTVCERDAITRCAETASSFSYLGSFPSITFRLGYDYNGGGNIGTPVRQYGTRLGCFNFPEEFTLPVRLLSFAGAYREGKTLLSWETDNEVNFDHYEIERSNNNSDFVAIATTSSRSTSNASKQSYAYTDDLTASNDKVFYYRLRMVDIDGRYSYSNTIMVRKDQSRVKGLLLSPNPVVGNGTVTIRLNAEVRQAVEVRVIDATGKLVLKQQNQVSEGLNSISINNQARLQPGIYTVQIMADDEILSSKLSVIR